MMQKSKSKLNRSNWPTITYPILDSGFSEKIVLQTAIVPVIKNLDAKILEVIQGGSGQLEMESWHTCKTTHCRGGWAIALAGPQGKKLERQFDTEQAAALIYFASTGRVPNFYADNKTAMADIRKQARKQLAAK